MSFFRLPQSVRGSQFYTLVSKEQIISLYKRFQRLDKDGSGTLSQQELMSIPEFAMNPLAPRMVAVFLQAQLSRQPSISSSDQIDFLTFAHTLSQFSNSATQRDKLDLALRIIDCDGDSLVSIEDISSILKLMVGDQVPDAELTPISKALFSELVLKARGPESSESPISKEEFFSILLGRPSLDFLTLPILHV